MRIATFFLCLFLAACDRVTSPSVRDAGVDSVASLWESVDAGSVNFNAIAGQGADNVLIVGDQGTILHWDGQSLVPEASGTLSHLRGVAILSESIAYAVGEQGTILRRQDGVWSAEPTLTPAVLNAIAVGPNYAVAVGEQGTLLVRYQDAWGPVANPRTDNFYTVTDSNDGILIGGSLGIVVHIDIATRTIANQWAIPGYTKVLAGSARFQAGAYFVGVDGGIFYWVKDKATRIEGLPQKFLRGVSVQGGTAYMVGHEGLVATLVQGGKPAVVPTLDDRWLLGVYAAAPDDVWFVGRSGLVLRGLPGVRGVRFDGGIRD